MKRAKSQRQRRGVILVSSPAVIIMLCVLAGLMVDYGYMHVSISRMQSAADSAAIATAMRVGNENTVATRLEAQSWGITYANYNEPGNGDVLVANDVVFGNWDPATKTFVANPNTPDAVQVLVRRDGTNTESVATMFMSLFGVTEIGLTTTAIATLSGSSTADTVPMALRAPNFGDVDPNITPKNPAKDGPSSPADGQAFVPGEPVVVSIYGQGSQPPVHLTLDIDVNGPGADPAETMKILKGTIDPVEMQVGDQGLVFNNGTGSVNYSESLDDRLDLPSTDPSRDIVMPVVETIAGSRDGNGKLTGQVRIADFVSVHLDGTVEETYPDPSDPNKTIKVKYLMGTIQIRRSETSSGGATPSGAGGGTVSTIEIVQ